MFSLSNQVCQYWENDYDDAEEEDNDNVICATVIGAYPRPQTLLSRCIFVEKVKWEGELSGVLCKGTWVITYGSNFWRGGCTRRRTGRAASVFLFFIFSIQLVLMLLSVSVSMPIIEFQNFLAFLLGPNYFYSAPSTFATNDLSECWQLRSANPDNQTYPAAKTVKRNTVWFFSWQIWTT